MPTATATARGVWVKGRVFGFGLGFLLELRRWKREERNNGLLLYALVVYVVMYFVLATVQ
jgi:hypothetical protein